MTPRRGRPEADVIDEISFTVQPGHVLGLVGESGSGKTTVALALLGLLQARTQARRRQGARRRPGHPRAARTRSAETARPYDRLRPAGPGQRAEPGAEGRHPAARGLHHPRRRPGPAYRRAGRGRAGGPGPDPRRLPAPAFRRPAAAGRPGHGVRLPAAADRARRADHRPRRHHPAPRPGHRARAVPDLPGGRRLHHPRPRRGGRDRQPCRGAVRRTADRDGSGAGAVRDPGPSVHPRADAGRARAGRHLRAARHGRQPATAWQPPARMLLPAAVRVRGRPVRAAPAGTHHRVRDRARRPVRACRGDQGAVRHRHPGQRAPGAPGRGAGAHDQRRVGLLHGQAGAA